MSWPLRGISVVRDPSCRCTMLNSAACAAAGSRVEVCDLCCPGCCGRGHVFCSGIDDCGLITENERRCRLLSPPPDRKLLKRVLATVKKMMKDNSSRLMVSGEGGAGEGLSYL